MRVLHVLEAIEGGVSRHVAGLITYVPGEHEVCAPPERVGGYTDRSAFAAFEAAGAPVHLMPMRRLPPHPDNLRAGVALRRLIRRRRPDVVHGHASIGGALARVAATGTSAARVYTPHTMMPRRSALAIERALGRLTDAFIAVSPSEADFARDERVVPADRIHMVPNGIEVEQAPLPVPLDLRERLGVAGGVSLVGMVARLAPAKAPGVFLDACAVLAERSGEPRFVLIGDGPDRGDVAERIRSLGLEDRLLHIRGLQDAHTVMPQLDVLALPSRYEAAPYAPLEAMRAGVPVVASDVPGNRDTIAAGRTGLLVPVEDPRALADGIQRLLGDRELASRLAAAGRAELAERFDVRRTAERTLEVYRSLLRS